MYLIHLVSMQYENVTTQTHTCCWLQPVDKFTWATSTWLYSHDVVYTFMHTKSA